MYERIKRVIKRLTSSGLISSIARGMIYGESVVSNGGCTYITGILS